MRTLIGLATVLTLALTTAPANSKGPFGYIGVGNWKGGAFTNDADEFTGCIASAGYKSGIIFTVMVDAQGKWRLGFSHQNWNLEQSLSFPIVLTFDGKAPFNVTGVPINRNMVGVEMPVDSSLIKQFRESVAMSAFAKGQVFQFKLQSTSLLLPTLANCVATIRKNGIASAGDFSIAVRPAQSAVGGSFRPDTNAPGQSAELQIEAIELASNFILKSALRNPKVLSRSETPVSLVNSGAAWRSEEAVGFVRVIPPEPNMKGIDVAAAIVGSDAKDCKAKFASGRTSELVDSEVVFRGFSSCEDSDGMRLAQYFIVSRKKGGFVMFSVSANAKSDEAKNVTRDERLVDFKKAALIAVSQ